MSRRSFRTLDAGRRFGRPDADRVHLERVRQEERWRRARALGIVGACLLHIVLLLLFRQSTFPPMTDSSAAGPPAGDLRAAAGGSSGLTMVEVRPQRSAPPVEEVPQPVPVSTEVVVEPVEIPPEEPVLEADPGPEVVASLPGVEAPGPGGNAGPATGPGNATGDGDGGGGTGDGGAARIFPPTPRGLFIPPAGRPASARGLEITVWVFVGENGRVERSTVRLEPPTSDSRYNQRLVQSVAEWVFDPAHQDGRPVPAWYPFQIIL